MPRATASFVRCSESTLARASIGTLRGIYGYCVDYDTFKNSDELYEGDGWTQIEAAKGT